MCCARVYGQTSLALTSHSVEDLRHLPLVIDATDMTLNLRVEGERLAGRR